jgi:hypothetical protein
MYNAKIIVPLHFSKWVSNLVPTCKKYGEIKLCIDFQNLNKVSLKDNYPLPKVDHILQRVVGSNQISLLDSFLGYNQVLVHPDGQDKTTMGHFHVCENAFWFDECWSHFLESNGYRLCGRIR